MSMNYPSDSQVKAACEAALASLKQSSDLEQWVRAALGAAMVHPSMPRDRLRSMINAWVDGEPFEVSQGRTGRPVVSVHTGDQRGYLNGYTTAVAHVAAILDHSSRSGIDYRKENIRTALRFARGE